MVVLSVQVGSVMEILKTHLPVVLHKALILTSTHQMVHSSSSTQMNICAPVMSVVKLYAFTSSFYCQGGGAESGGGDRLIILTQLRRRG